MTDPKRNAVERAERAEARLAAVEQAWEEYDCGRGSAAAVRKALARGEEKHPSLDLLDKWRDSIGAEVLRGEGREHDEAARKLAAVEEWIAEALAFEDDPPQGGRPLYAWELREKMTNAILDDKECDGDE